MEKKKKPNKGTQGNFKKKQNSRVEGLLRLFNLQHVFCHSSVPDTIMYLFVCLFFPIYPCAPLSSPPPFQPPYPTHVHNYFNILNVHLFMGLGPLTMCLIAKEYALLLFYRSHTFQTKPYVFRTHPHCFCCAVLCGCAPICDFFNSSDVVSMVMPAPLRKTGGMLCFIFF